MITDSGMSLNSSGFPPCTKYGDIPPALPLEEYSGMEGTLCSNRTDGYPIDMYGDAATKRSSSLRDCVTNYESYPVDQTPFVDRTHCKTFDKCFVDTETVDTAADTTSLPETDYPIDSFDIYTNDGNGRYLNHVARGTPAVPEDGSYDTVRPVIRLKSTSDSNAAIDTSGHYKVSAPATNSTNVRTKRLYPCACQGNGFEPGHNLEDFMRSSGQLYHPFYKSGVRHDGSLQCSSDVMVTTPSFSGSIDQPIMRPFGVPGSLPSSQNTDTQSDNSDLFLTPPLSSTSSCFARNYHGTSNYCVYVGSETNRLACGCNIARPSGGNCHVSRCPLVTSELEPCTEHWPVSGSSNLQSLVRRLHCVVERYKSSSSCCDEAKMVVAPVTARRWPNEGRVMRGGSSDTLLNRSFEYSKRSCTVSSEFSVAREDNPTPDYYVQTSYEDSPYDNNFTTGDVEAPVLPRKSHCSPKSNFGRELESSSRNEFGRFVSTLTTSPGSTPETRTQYTTPKPKKKSTPSNTQNGEKVSGVWYDANRHLWRVVYMKGNKRKTQGFSSIKLGYEEARRKAIEMRHEMVALRRTDKI
ncbi:uncharacterized protein BXIN_1453 [Babesia sp. Xinjiang]|uniref:uncharacterized protein n=1 Tax=Babesia sp. Xinjiang TaxID=462227 RepID=UPI000A242C92|nr:uncharacterized protein BXIN_1453 [Babesia sp. Xinjiang]ORM40067.1 hypothetical protein BXIN_1453 [Babesia sp. Xinjiang]